ncbi:MAG: hypothetical protein WAK60_09890 [Sedimentisphaerales bacterium]
MNLPLSMQGFGVSKSLLLFWTILRKIVVSVPLAGKITLQELDSYILIL